MATRRVIKKAPAAAKAEADKKQRMNGTSAKVQEYLEKHPDEHVWASDIMKATGLTKLQVQNAISYLRSATFPGERVAIIRPGNAWRYRAPATTKAAVPDIPAPTAEMQVGKPASSLKLGDIRVVGQWSNGTIALDINGEPYLAKPA